jgi:hypothetical protein
MDLSPPAGSKISIVNEGNEPIIVIPVVVTRAAYFAALLAPFLLFGAISLLLGGIGMLLSGKEIAFSIFLVGVSAAGIVTAAQTIYRSRKRPVHETLTLKRNGVSYDSGLVPLRSKGRRIDFPKRIRLDLDQRQLQSLRLRGNECGRWRLTVDGADRVEIARNASGVEREWLARFLANRYSIPQIWAAADDT